MMWRALMAAAVLALAGPAAAEEAATWPKTYFVGQDFGSVRDYYLSQCCVAPDGVTTYIGLYDILTPPNFGGLGLDAHNKPTFDADWGAGPINAHKSASGLPARSLAIGLSLTEEGRPGAVKQIAEGHFDAEIDQLATFISGSGKVVFLRIGYEFDGAWNAGYGDPAAYVAAWRHIVDRMDARGVTNAVYVWQFSSAPLDDLIDGGHEDIALWYPGDDYVDFMGLSWFLDPTIVPPPNNGFTALSQGALRDELMALAEAHDKPVMIAELSPQGYDLKAGHRADISPLLGGKPGKNRVNLSDDEIWNAWYAPLFAWLDSHPRVRSIAYINADWDSQKMWGAPYASGYWGNSRLQDKPAIAKRWNAAVAAWKAKP